MGEYEAKQGTYAENEFVELFEETFGPEKTSYLFQQYPFQDIYGQNRFADFLLEQGCKKIAIEIDDIATHHKGLVSQQKINDDLLKQNSMIFKGWDIYRWTVPQIRKSRDNVKDELQLFLGNNPNFKVVDDYLPTQKGKVLDSFDLELKEHQKEALKDLEEMRQNHETIALLNHATGTGKTVTAISDAKRFNQRTLFVVQRNDLVNQAYDQFKKIWPEKNVGKFSDGIHEKDAFIVCASIQSLTSRLEDFSEKDFGYLIIDEAHHAASDTYQKILSFFKPEFTLGLTATPERNDLKNIMDIFKNTAHKLDLEKAVEIGELVSVRCIRVKTNIDLTNVHFNSHQYNLKELEQKIYVPDRNNLIVQTYLDYVKGKRTVIFCVSVEHAENLAKLLNDSNVPAKAVSGSMKTSERLETTDNFKQGKIQVLCACDLLNEGWDCPETEVLFMARPTMSKMLYIQQLGRGMRLAQNKECLIVFDFVDNSTSYNAPYSLHRLTKKPIYRPGQFVIAPEGKRKVDEGLYAKGEKPDAIIDYPIDIHDLENIDLFNWQEQAENMISTLQFVRQVDVQSETVEKYIREQKIIPDLIVPVSETRKLNFFNQETVEKYAKEFNWMLIDKNNRKDLFMDMIKKMNMSFSYKPVFMLAIMKCADEKGYIELSSIVSYFKNFYQERKNKGEFVEKEGSIFAKNTYTDKEVINCILSNPFKRFEDMDFMHHTKTLGKIAIDSDIWKKLTKEDKEQIESICKECLDDYFFKNSQKAKK